MVATSPIITSTKVGLISNALVLCGEKPLNSISDTRYGASVGAQLFDLIYENELQSNRWRFTCTKAALALLNVIPPNEWQYAYQLPTDMLMPIGIWGVGPTQLYEIYSNHLYTNCTSNPGPQGGANQTPVLTFDYQFKPDVSVCPSYFTTLLTYALAKDMIKPITESDTAAGIMEKKYMLQRNRAMFADAQGRPNRALQDRPFIQVR
jgi:hypothetical protein